MVTLLSTGKKMPVSWRRLAVFAITMLLAAGAASGLPAPRVAEASATLKVDPGGGSASSCLTLSPMTVHTDLEPDPSVACGRLANGFGYLLMKNEHPEGRVSIHLYVRAGSLNETASQRGLAHFLEHMQFNGSTHFPPGELVRYFQTIGMQFGNDANAHTSFDETVYDIVLPTGDEDNLKKGLLVMQDYAMGASLLEEEIKRERGVILAEMRSRDSAGYRTFKATLQFELPRSLIAKRLPIGNAETIKKADRPILKSFYDTWYRPDNMVLVMVGDFEFPVARALIETRFAAFSPRAPKATPPDIGTIDHKGLEVFYHHEPETGGTTVSIEVVRPFAQQPDSVSLRRRELIAQIADGIVQHRLDRIQKKPGTPFTSAAAGSGVYLNHVRYAEISADSNARNWKATLAILEHELRRARRYGFGQAELGRVKKEMLSALENAVKEAPTRNSTQLARNMMRDLSRGRVIQSPLQEKRLLEPLIASVSLADVHQAFVDNWPDDHRLVLVTGNANLAKSTTVSPVLQIRNAFLAAAGTVVRPPEAEAETSFPYLPDPNGKGTIVSREVIADLGITRIRFKNGVSLNLKPTDYKTNEVLANLIFGLGKSQEPPDLPGLALLSEAAVNESGLGAMDTNQLERALAGKRTSVEFTIQDGYFNYSARSVSDEMELLFQLFYAHLRDPGFRDEAMHLARERLLQSYRSLSRSIEGMLRIEGLRILAGGDTRFGIPATEDLKAIDLQAVKDWILPQLTSAPLELSIVGDFDEDEVIALALRYLGSLPVRDDQSSKTRSDLPYLPEGIIHHIEVDTQISKAMVIAAWPTGDFWDIHRTRRLSVLADIFSERLRERIREKLGASYSPWAFNQASRAYTGYGSLQAHVTVAPDQAEHVLHEVKAIAGELARKGITDDELKRALDPILTSIKEYRHTNGYWLNSVMTGSGRAVQQLDWARSFMDDYRAITGQALDTLAATYLSGDRPAVLIIQPTVKAQN